MIRMRYGGCFLSIITVTCSPPNFLGASPAIKDEISFAILAVCEFSNIALIAVK
jgi:hypothetical protein